MPSNDTHSHRSTTTRRSRATSNVVDARLRFSARNDASAVEGYSADERSSESSDLLHRLTRGTPADLRHLREALRDDISPELFDAPSIVDAPSAPAASLGQGASLRRDILDTIEYRDLMSTHLPSEVLVALAFDVDLGLESDTEPAIDRATAEAHLAVCPSCREELALMLGTEAETASITPQRQTTPATWRAAVALAAMLLLAVLVPALVPSTWSPLGPGDATPQSTVATGAPTAPASEPSHYSGSLLIDGFESQDLSAWSAVGGLADTSNAR